MKILAIVLMMVSAPLMAKTTVHERCKVVLSQAYGNGQHNFVPAGYGRVVELDNSFVAEVDGYDLKVSSGSLMDIGGGNRGSRVAGVDYRKSGAQPLFAMEILSTGEGALWDCPR